MFLISLLFSCANADVIQTSSPSLHISTSQINRAKSAPEGDAVEGAGNNSEDAVEGSGGDAVDSEGDGEEPDDKDDSEDAVEGSGGGEPDDKDESEDAVEGSEGDAVDSEDEAISDPFEKLNRKIFEFNDKLDKKILTPLMSGNSKIIPKPIKDGIINFSNNFFELPRAFNYTLQANGKNLGNTLMRFFLNTTMGFFGVADVAEKLGFKKTDTSFGHTLKKWGVPPGAFVVLPIFGPNSMRGATSMLHHIAIDQLTLLPCKNWTKPAKYTTFWTTYIINLLSARSAIGQLMQYIDATSKDPYKVYRSVIMSMEK